MKKNWGTMHDAPPGCPIEIPANGRGQLYSLRVSQPDGDPGGQIIYVYSSYPGGEARLGTVTISPRAALPGTRVAAIIYSPGVDFIYGICQSSPATLPRPMKLRLAFDPGAEQAGSTPGITLISP